jgi:hypothetical protein
LNKNKRAMLHRKGGTDRVQGMEATKTPRRGINNMPIGGIESQNLKMIERFVPPATSINT